jgi:predicted flap endonuclease-1-like 5' DNA nuclease
MVALSLQTLALMGVAYLLGAIVACAVRRALYRASHQAAATAERRVDPLPDVAAASAARFVQPAPETRPPMPEPPAAKPATVVAAPGQPAQDLTRIRGIDAALSAALGKLGVTRYEQIATWMRGDIDRIEQSLGQKGRISHDNWIEQAQILAKGGETRYASRLARGETAKAEPTPDEGERRPAAPTLAATSTPLRAPITVTARPATRGASAVVAEIIAPKLAPAPEKQPEAATPPRPEAPVTPPDVASRAAFAEPRTTTAAATTSAAESERAVPIRPAAPTARDNLQRISGIDAQTEQRLAAQAVTRYSQVAHWTPADVERFERLLGTTRRIARENWIEQAQILSRGGDTAYSREFDRRETEAAAQLRPAKITDAIREHTAAKSGDDGKAAPARPDLGSLRSVRSEAYQTADPGPDAARRAANQTKMVRSATLEDLKRIRGIGVLIEKKLNSMGVVSYEQIANWSAADIDRVSQSLDFKGRIERENWVEQARILASGGATEFSRRMDRGEIETSRSRN